jgi:hypothetical protein
MASYAPDSGLSDAYLTVAIRSRPVESTPTGPLPPTGDGSPDWTSPLGLQTAGLGFLD